jgi:hypothetical protein
MANSMMTYVKVGNLNEETHKKFVELFENSQDSLSHINKLYGTEFETYDDVSRMWMDENVGAKSISVDCENLEYDSQIVFALDTAWSVPTEYLQKLVEVIGGDVVVYGTYEDEGYAPIGAFVYATDYDVIEDYEEDIDFEEMVNNDEYYEETYNNLYLLLNTLYTQYLDIMEERKQEKESI